MEFLKTQIQERNNVMGKRYLDFHYLPEEMGTYCVVKRKKYIGVGAALYKKSDISDHPTKLVGETVAHLKAERDVLKQRLADKKTELRTIEKFCVYLFPPKYDDSIGWIYPRRDKRIAEIKKEIEIISKDIEKINETIVSYLDNKKKFWERIKKKRETNESTSKH